MKNTTPTEFLIHHILHSEFETDEEWQKVFEQAKEMEKQEIIEATKYGNSFEQGDLRCETYYKNTYEKEN